MNKLGIMNMLKKMFLSFTCITLLFNMSFSLNAISPDLINRRLNLLDQRDHLDTQLKKKAILPCLYVNLVSSTIAAVLTRERLSKNFGCKFSAKTAESMSKAGAVSAYFGTFCLCCASQYFTQCWGIFPLIKRFILPEGRRIYRELGEVNRQIAVEEGVNCNQIQNYFHDFRQFFINKCTRIRSCFNGFVDGIRRYRRVTVLNTALQNADRARLQELQYQGMELSQASVQAIQNIQFDADVLRIFASGECPICLEEYSEKQVLAARQCGHIYCYECYNKLQRYQQRCAICRDSKDGGTGV